MTVNEIFEAAKQRGGPRFAVNQALHLTAKGEVVREGDPAGRFVLVGAGGSLPADLARALGLDIVGAECPQDVPLPLAPAETPKLDEKAVKPQMDKAIRPQENK